MRHADPGMWHALLARTGSANDLDVWVPELDQTAYEQHSCFMSSIGKFISALDSQATALLALEAWQEHCKRRLPNGMESQKTLSDHLEGITGNWPLERGH